MSDTSGGAGQTFAVVPATSSRPIPFVAALVYELTEPCGGLEPVIYVRCDCLTTADADVFRGKFARGRIDEATFAVLQTKVSFALVRGKLPTTSSGK